MTHGAILRPARCDECAALDDICFRSKAHWGYDAGFMASVRDQIRVDPAAILAGRVWVTTDSGDRPCGVVQVDPLDETVADLTLLFIDPDFMRRGLGRALYAKALDLAASLGAHHLVIDADPQAAAFYASMGALRTGAEPTGYQGRLLPKFRVALKRPPMPQPITR
ncbi:GNAT family N-acetyltransferase [Dongia rigui]|uniref:GNAT family N-acetyltransferase n=1 Tax=Dongia rigui TaxID=940149 RepID=A0ABU5E3P5_9PROT|nr:GNAT family N-acetyltransferase [Dongia rigui]MDY0873528.1 GNAT family N-acetyltransferase [Dongia rigui]